MTPVSLPKTERDSSFCISLNTARVSLALVGGKALNLAHLAQAGLPVPGGFIVTTDGYDAFAKRAGMTERIAAEASKVDLSDPDTVNSLSEQIRSRFRAGYVPQELEAQIRAAYDDLSRPKVAVRSSATAQDLTGMSFAGQQDTFLNILGNDTLLLVVIDCFSSLWSAWAISYRARNGMEQSEVALAVIVQEMVQSESSGVLLPPIPLRADEPISSPHNFRAWRSLGQRAGGAGSLCSRDLHRPHPRRVCGCQVCDHSRTG